MPKRVSETCAFKVNETEQSGDFGVLSLFGASSLQIFRAPRLWDIYVSCGHGLSPKPVCVECIVMQVLLDFVIYQIIYTFQPNILHSYNIIIMVLIIILAQNHSHLFISLHIYLCFD